MLVLKLLRKINMRFCNDHYRLKHILGVTRMSVKLARKYNVNLVKAQIAALLHDYTKNESLNFHVNVLSKGLIKKYQLTPYIYHAFSGAYIAQKEFEICDIAILNAIKRHVWGHKNMTKLDKIILLSDKIEPQRQYAQVNYFRKLAFIDLNRALYELLQFNYNLFTKKGYELHSEQIEVIEFLQKKYGLYRNY